MDMTKFIFVDHGMKVNGQCNRDNVTFFRTRHVAIRCLALRCCAARNRNASRVNGPLLSQQINRACCIGACDAFIFQQDKRSVSPCQGN